MTQHKLDKIPGGRFKKITSTSNPLIKMIRSYALKKNRDSEGVFLAEGHKLIADAINPARPNRHWTIKKLVATTQGLENTKLAALAAAARTQGADILEVTNKVMGSISRKDNPQMALGVFEQKWCSLPETISLDSQNNHPVWIGLDRIRDPGNLGTIIRTADAAGAQAIILIGQTTDPWSLEAVRASMGSIFAVDLYRCEWEEFVRWRAHWPGKLVGTHLKATLDYRNVNYDDEPILLLMGNEQQGLTDEMIDQCDEKVLIPMQGDADSLNLAVSTAVMLFEARRSHLRVPDLVAQ